LSDEIANENEAIDRTTPTPASSLLECPWAISLPIVQPIKKPPEKPRIHEMSDLAFARSISLYAALLVFMISSILSGESFLPCCLNCTPFDIRISIESEIFCE